MAQLFALGPQPSGNPGLELNLSGAPFAELIRHEA
jgi:hypothetical protein